MTIFRDYLGSISSSLTVFNETGIARVSYSTGKNFAPERRMQTFMLRSYVQDVFVVPVSGDAAMAERLPKRYRYGDVH